MVYHSLQLKASFRKTYSEQNESGKKLKTHYTGVKRKRASKFDKKDSLKPPKQDYETSETDDCSEFKLSVNLR